MALPIILAGINGAIGLYSTVKGLLDSAESKKKQQRLRKSIKDEENAWYRKNYYGNFINDSATQAAIKRVENSLRRNNEQERTRGVVTGATPEYAVARNEQALRSLDSLMTNIASGETQRKKNVDDTHLRNKMLLASNELQSLSLDEQSAKSSANSGFNLIQNAILGVNWGKER